MTQEFVTLPREVVEQAIEALFCTDSEEGSTAYKNELEAVKKLRSALEQPQANQPAMTPIAQRKLDSLLAEGYTISGYSVYHEQKHQHGFVTGAGLVGWWKPEGVEYPQPQVEQDPVAKVVLTEQLGLPCLQWLDLDRQFDFKGGELLYTHPQPKREPVGEAGPMPGADGFTMACFRASDVSVGTELYTRPQPKREPLTDEEIDKLCPQFDDPMRREMWNIGFKAAHNIK